MMLSEFIAAQLRQPSGLIGRYFILHSLNRRNAPINTLALEQLRLAPGERVLEVGFGGGDLLMRMTRMRHNGQITGVDFSKVAVSACTKRFRKQVRAGTIDLHCADIAQLPFEADSFRKVCTVNTIYFWSTPVPALAEIRRVLKREGSVVVCFSPRKEMEGREVMRHGFTLYDPEEVSMLLTSAGFRDVHLVFRKRRFGECIAAVGKK